MDTKVYDVVTVGGGMGGAGLACLMAQAGARVLVLERTPEFTDRVRGEALMPWGLAEARRLGFDELLRSIGNELRWWDVVVNGATIGRRDIPATCLPGLPALTYFHPWMQTRLLHAAEDAGADVLRDARVTTVAPGAPPEIGYRYQGRARTARARLVVGADGRASTARASARFATRRDPERRLFAGVLFEHLLAPEDVLYSAFLPGTGLMTYLFPQGDGRVRAYLGFQAGTGIERFQGSTDMPRFVETAIRAGVPEEYYRRAIPRGPLATYDGTDEWVPHPYRHGVALIGDAAATSDPTWGQGMSLTLRDVRVLRDRLLAGDDWEAAGHAYAEEHDAYYQAIRTAHTWYTDLFLDVGPEADERRLRALPLVALDLTRIPDTGIGGPEVPADEAARRRFFAEDAA